MPVLSKTRETKKITLLTDTTAWVEVYAKQNYGDYLAVQKASMGTLKVNANSENAGETDADLTAFMLTTLDRMVAGWNFTDENGVALPVTLENLQLLATEDALHIFTQLQGDSEAAGLPQDDESKKVEANS